MAASKILTLGEFISGERVSRERREWVGGRVVDVRAMAGGTREHSRIKTNLLSALHGRLGVGGCETYDSDLGVALVERGDYVYPDATVVCGAPVYWEEGRRDVVTNPTAVYEVLSPSSARYDQGEKRDAYASTSSIQEIVTVHFDSPRIDRYVRFEGGWRWKATVGLGTTLRTLELDIPMSEIYAGVEFPAE